MRAVMSFYVPCAIITLGLLYTPVLLNKIIITIIRSAGHVGRSIRYRKTCLGG